MYVQKSFCAKSDPTKKRINYITGSKINDECFIEAIFQMRCTPLTLQDVCVCEQHRQQKPESTEEEEEEEEEAEAASGSV